MAEKPAFPWRWIARAVVGIALAAVVALGADVQRIGQTLAGAKLEWFALAVTLYVSSQAAGAVRWRMLAKCVGLRRSRWRMLSLYFQGAFFSLCLPSSIGGDFYKAYKLGGSLGERGLALATVAADRAAGLVAMIVLASAGALLTSCGWPLAVYPLLVAVVGLVAFGVAAAVSRFMPGWLTWASRIPKLGPAIEKLRPWAESPIAQGQALAGGLVVQSLNIAAVGCLGVSLGLDVPTLAYVIVVPLTAIATLLPITVNGVGVREGSLAMLLAPYGATAAQSVSLGAAWFIVTLFSGLLGGVIYLCDSSDRRAQAPAPARRPTRAPTSGLFARPIEDVRS